MTNAEKLADAQAELADIVKRIEAHNVGDKPSSPPVSLIHEEQRLRLVVEWFEQVEREDRKALKREPS